MELNIPKSEPATTGQLVQRRCRDVRTVSFLDTDNSIGSASKFVTATLNALGIMCRFGIEHTTRSRSDEPPRGDKYGEAISAEATAGEGSAPTSIAQSSTSLAT